MAERIEERTSERSLAENMTDHLPYIYTLDEAAEHLRLTNRGVAKIARRHGLCMLSGRKLLFSDKDIEAIRDTLRFAPAMPRHARIKLAPPTRPPYQNDMVKWGIRKKKPGRLRWEDTYSKQSAERESTKAALAKWKDVEPIDRANRDPDYWTPERRERLRLERLARKKGWAPQRDD